MTCTNSEKLMFPSLSSSMSAISCLMVCSLTRTPCPSSNIFESSGTVRYPEASTSKVAKSLRFCLISSSERRSSPFSSLMSSAPSSSVAGAAAESPLSELDTGLATL